MENNFLALESSWNIVLNINMKSNMRLQALQKIKAYTNGLINMTMDNAMVLKAVLNAITDELSRDKINEECIGGYNRILREMLGMSHGLRGRKCVIYGDNWLAKEMAGQMHAQNYYIFNWRMVNPAYINEYDLYLLCDEPLKSYGLPSIQNKENIINLWDYLKHRFIAFPSFYKTYLDMKQQNPDKVKCIVTGNTNIVNAVRSNLLHVSAVSLANYGQDIFYDFKMFCHAYESMSHVEYAVIGLSPFSLRYDISKSKDECRHCFAYYPVIGAMHNYEDKKYPLTVFEAEDKKVKQFFDEEYIESLYGIYENSSNESAEEKNTVFDSQRLSKESAAINMQEIVSLYDRPFTDILLENKVILEEYARFCHTKGIKVIFLIPPYTRWYKEHMNTAYYEELVAAVKVLCSKYAGELVDMMPVEVLDCCFTNYADLNYIGAVKVASYLNAIFER